MKKYYFSLFVFVCSNVTAMELRNGKSIDQREETRRDLIDAEHAMAVPPIMLTAEKEGLFLF